jgi:hypothetical protein
VHKCSRTINSLQMKNFMEKWLNWHAEYRSVLPHPHRAPCTTHHAPRTVHRAPCTVHHAP